MTSLSNMLKSLKQKLDKETVITIALFVIIAVGGLGYWLYANNQNNIRAAAELKEEKARFAVVEKDMAAAYEQMVVGLEKPGIEKKDSRSCGRTSQKFEEGQLYCGISYGFAYKVSNYDAARERLFVLMQKLADNKVLRPDSESLNKSLSDRESTGYEQEKSIEVPIKTDNGFTCKMYMSIVKSDEKIDNYSLEGNERVSTYAFGCSEDVKQPVYPLAK